MKKVRLTFIWAITTLLLVSASWNSNIIDTKGYLLSDDQGPEFKDLGNFYADFLTNDTNEARIHLHLFVTVRDSDGIDTVIGSYKDINGTIWRNVTLTLYGTLNDDWMYYVGDGENVTLNLEKRIKIWNVKYYANDTLGNWNVSDVMRNSYYLMAWQEPPPNPLFVIGSIIGIVGICAVALLVWRKRRI
ncbi:MAG: hypothetical protein ACW98Y_15550 [Candidatus Thorarchaeota archaeon]|jgi:hypothetical protein